MPVWLRWQPPKLRLEEEAREARVTSVDLFYDLIFGAVVAQLALGLSRDVTAGGLLLFALLFVAVVRVWSSETFYSDHFETLDASYRLSVLAAMLCAGGLAVAVPQGFGGLFPVFALSMAAARIVLVVQWLRVRRHEPPARGLARRYALLYGWVCAIWLAAAAGPQIARMPLAIGAVLLDLAAPLLATRLQNDLAKFSSEHLSDRFGAFFLVVLGQMVVLSVVEMTRLRAPTFADLFAGMLAFMAGFTLWWVYVDHAVGRTLREGDPWNAVWSYMNIPVFMATGAFGSAVIAVVTRADLVAPDAVRWLLAGSFGCVILFAGLAELALEPLPNTVRFLRVERHGSRLALVHGAPAALAVLVALLGHGLTVVPLLLLLLATGVFAVVLGEYVRAGQ
jgi:low temperature requirement protein LtrA